MNADWMLSVIGVFVEPRRSTRCRHIRAIAWSQLHRVDTVTEEGTKQENDAMIAPG